MNRKVSAKFIILGAGAIGCYVGARLTAAHYPTVLVGRPRVIDSLAESGLRVTDQEGFDVTLTARQLCMARSLKEGLHRLAMRSDDCLVVLVCVKSTATESAALEILQDAPEGTVVVSLQNGVDNVERIVRIAPQFTVLAGMVPFTVGWRNPCHVVKANLGELQIARSTHSERFSQCLIAAGVGVELQQNMDGVLWGKLLINLINPVNALANRPIREMMLQRDYRRIFAALQSEALLVLKAAGIEPMKASKVGPDLMPKIMNLPDWLFKIIAAGMLKMDPIAKTSMCDDVQNNRPTEIDYLCGAIVRMAQRYGVAAPLNQAVSELIKSGQPGVNWTAGELAAALKC